MITIPAYKELVVVVVVVVVVVIVVAVVVVIVVIVVVVVVVVIVVVVVVIVVVVVLIIVVVLVVEDILLLELRSSMTFPEEIIFFHLAIIYLLKINEDDFIPVLLNTSLKVLIAFEAFYPL